MLVFGENSLFTILLFLQTIKDQKNIVPQVREMQDQIYTSGEFNFQYTDDRQRDKAMLALIRFFESDQAQLATKSENGIDLEGNVVYKGVVVKNGTVLLGHKWYAAYVRTATNEKGVVRSYISSGNSLYGEKIRQKMVKLLKEEHNGTEIE